MTDTEKANVAKHYLMKCKYLNLEIDTRIEALYRVKTPNYMQPIQSNANRSYDSILNDKITKIDELHEELKSIWDLVDELGSKGVNEAMYCSLLSIRYILGFNQKETAKIMRLSLSHLKHLQRDALVAFYDVLEAHYLM